MSAIIASGREIELLTMAFSIGAIYLMVRRSIGGKTPTLRRLPALDAVDEFIGRSVEMGRPVLTCPGSGWGFMQSDQNPQFMAFLSLLSYVGRKSYESGTKVLTFTTIPEMIPLSQQTLLESSRIVGSPELYQESHVRYYPGQLPLVAATRSLYESDERPGAFIFVGAIMGENIFMTMMAAERGVPSLGGTTGLLNLPILVATCDYVLIGEEIYAAGAYLDKEPFALGAIVGQDIVKSVALLALFVGFVLSQFLR